jgi:hypothetical protein
LPDLEQGRIIYGDSGGLGATLLHLGAAEGIIMLPLGATVRAATTMVSPPSK